MGRKHRGKHVIDRHSGFKMICEQLEANSLRTFSLLLSSWSTEGLNLDFFILFWKCLCLYSDLFEVDNLKLNRSKKKKGKLDWFRPTKRGFS